jgi:hypothetical protein
MVAWWIGDNSFDCFVVLPNYSSYASNFSQLFGADKSNNI